MKIKNEKEIVVELNGVTKIYDNVEVLNDLNLKITKNKIYGLLGRNGIGKTTLLKIITNQINDFKGNVVVDPEISFGIMINDLAVNKNMTAYENLKSQLILANNKNYNLIPEILKQVDLSDDNKLVCNFSLGMLQKLKLAMVLIYNPNFVILDEPTNGLDYNSVMEFKKLLDKLKSSGVTIIISSHQLNFIEDIADEFIILNNKGQNYNITREKINIEKIDLEKLYLKITEEVTHG